MKQSKQLCLEVAKFLASNTEYSVEVLQSTLRGAGSGLFTRRNVKYREILTLYPGVYVPGIPVGINTSLDPDDAVFLGGIRTPSGKAAQDNEYILNLWGHGYIDGLALETSEGRPLCSDHALGHLINHKLPPNVFVTPFCWSDVDIGCYEKLSNVVRADGTLRCLVGDSVLLYDTKNSRVFGAAIQASKDLVPGEELFMDYGLTEPYPAWAIEWYNAK